MLKKAKQKIKFFILLIVFIFFCPFINTIYANTFTYEDLEFKYEHDALWVKVFYHNSSTGEFFSSLEETLNVNTKYKYSILNRIDEFKTGNTYEFLLEYPELSGYNRWTQTSNPTTTLEKVEGYNPINISWTTYYWNGLCLSNTTGGFIEGSVGHGNWYYTIGCKSHWVEDNHIPGPSSAVQEVYLWLRVDGNYNLYDEYQKSIKANHTFAKVFSQNTRYGIYFTNENEALNTFNYYNYSILNKLDTFFINGKYEFYLEYPEVSGYNHWTQTSNPINTLENVSNYVPISISWNNNYWGGLCKSNNGSSFLDGSVNHNNWWYSIACYTDKWLNQETTNGYVGFPGPNGTTVSICNLYARVDDGKDLIEPTITITNLNTNDLEKEYQIDINDNSNLSSINIYKLGNKENATTNSINQTTYSTNYKIKENGIYLVEATDVSGNINKNAITVIDINDEIPVINNISYTEDNETFNVNIEIGSNLENYEKIKYFTSSENLEETSLDINNFIETTNTNLMFNVDDIHSHYLYVYAFNKNTLKSELYKTQLIANVNVTFINENNETLSNIEIPYGSSVTNYVPNIEKNGYNLSWSESLDNIKVDTTIKTIWTIKSDFAAYSIIIPKTLIINGTTNACEYIVRVKGEMGDNAIINIVPNSEFYLNDVDLIKKPILAKVTQEKTTIQKNEIQKDTYLDIIGKVKLTQNLTAGQWKGTFDFQITTTPITQE